MILERIKELLMEQLNLDYDQLSADTRFDEVARIPSMWWNL